MPYGRGGAQRMQTSSLVELVYELLDAHADTADLASELVVDFAWRAHLEYLRALQHKGRETLAHTDVVNDFAAAPESAAARDLPAEQGR